MSDQRDWGLSLDRLIETALEAGEAILEIYRRDDLEVVDKADASPVTAADHAAEAVILEALASIAPEIPVVSEETSSSHSLALGDRFILVDPLDGTREFISRNGEFTVNIALVVDGQPVLGVVYAPAAGRLFAAAPSTGAFELARPAPGAPRRAIAVRPRPQDGLTVIASRSHSDEATEAYLRTVEVKERKSAGSSLKFCLIAAGEADLYPRTGRTMEWDTAAGHAVLAAAGGSVVTFDGEPLHYGKSERGLDNPGFIARGWS